MKSATENITKNGNKKPKKKTTITKPNKNWTQTTAHNITHKHQMNVNICWGREKVNEENKPPYFSITNLYNEGYTMYIFS